MNIIVVGAGAIGRERIRAIELLGEDIIAVCDPEIKMQGYKNYHTLRQAESEIPLEDIDWVFICTPHHETIPLVQFCLEHGLNILVEKPLGRTLGEFNQLMKYHSDEKIRVGFNYRFMDGVKELLKDVKEKRFGELISVNMILGLGDAPGTEKTWRLNPLQAGRGAILDPGCHLIDLAMIISNGNLTYIEDATMSKFWKTGFSEETHLLATDADDVIYNIQASKVRWRNNFRIEVNGTDAYGVVEGRGRNYGTQTYRRGIRWGWQYGESQKDSEALLIETDCENSFYEETKAVLYGESATHEDMKRILEFI